MAWNQDESYFFIKIWFNHHHFRSGLERILHLSTGCYYVCFVYLNVTSTPFCAASTTPVYDGVCESSRPQRDVWTNDSKKSASEKNDNYSRFLLCCSSFCQMSCKSSSIHEWTGSSAVIARMPKVYLSGRAHTKRSGDNSYRPSTL